MPRLQGFSRHGEISREREKEIKNGQERRRKKEEEVQMRCTKCLLYIHIVLNMKQPGRVLGVLWLDRRLVGVDDPISKVLAGAVCAL